MTELEPLQSDQQEGTLHPRETKSLYGHKTQEQRFLSAYNNNNLHHAWLLTGPKGIGKATLAWRIAKFLFAHQDNSNAELFVTGDKHVSLEIDENHIINNKVMALSEPGLLLIRCSYNEAKKQFNKNITVDQIRELNKFFSFSSTDGTRRIVIIDSVDDLNVNSANALLKSLEEPPHNSTFLLISHRPSMLLATIKSRCIELNCSPLKQKDLKSALIASGEDEEALDTGIITLASGSVGNAFRLLNLDAINIYKLLLEIVETFPTINGEKAIFLSEMASKKNNNQNIDIIIELIELVISRLAYSGIGKDFDEIITNEKNILAKICFNLNQSQKWASLLGELRKKINYGLKVNIDPGTLVLDMVLKMNKTARD